MKSADSRTFLISIPRGKENEKVVEENINKGIKTHCNDQMSVILQLQACSSKKIITRLFVTLIHSPF